MRLFLCMVLICFGLSVKAQTLDYYLESGLKNSPLLKAYIIQQESGIIDSLKVLAGYKPQVGLASDIMYPPAFGKFAYDSSITDGGHYAAMVSVTQPLFNKRFIKARLQTVTLDRLVNQNNRKISESELLEAITSQYLAAYEVFSKIQFEKGILRLLEEEKSALRELVADGIYQQTDYLNLSVTLAAREIQGKQLLMDYKNNVAILNLICGIHDTSAVNLDKPEIQPRRSFDPLSSPVIGQFRVDSLRFTLEKLLIDQHYLPRINAFADAGINATDPRRIPYSLGTSIGLNLSMPLYDGKQKQLDYRKIDLQERSRTNYQHAYLTRYEQQKDQLLQQVSLTDELLNSMKKQLADLEMLIDLYKAEINQGLVRWLDFITVINNYEETRNGLAQTEINRLNLINQLNYLK